MKCALIFQFTSYHFLAKCLYNIFMLNLIMKIFFQLPCLATVCAELKDLLHKIVVNIYNIPPVLYRVGIVITMLDSNFNFYFIYYLFNPNDLNAICFTISTPFLYFRRINLSNLCNNVMLPYSIVHSIVLTNTPIFIQVL